MVLAKMKNVAIFENVKLKRLQLPTLANIIMLGAILRIALLVYALFAPEIVYDGDSSEYLALAQNLAEQGVYESESDRPFPPDSVRPPIYAAFLALFHLLGDGTPFLALLMQMLLSIANIWLTFRLAKQLGASDKIAKLAALVLALDISSIIYSGTIMAETLFTTLLILFAGALHKTAEALDFRTILTISVFTAGLILTKPIAKFLPIASALFVFLLTHLALHKRILFAGLHIVLVVMLLMPWAIRNARKYDYPGISTVQGFNLLYYNGALAKARNEGISINVAEDSLTAELQAGLISEHISLGESAAAMQKLGIKTIFRHFGSYTVLH
ncbi:MAG: ArnT family glycosyltransferase, partial [bacterium]